MSSQFFSRGGEILPVEDAAVSLLSVEYAYGFGVYETIRALHGKCLFLPDHVERLFESAKIIRLVHQFTEQNISKWINDLVERNGSSTYNVKILLIGASDPESAQLFIFCSQPLFPDRKFYRDGVSMHTSEYERIYPHAKTLNMLQSYLSFRDAKSEGCYDALFINRKGNITEGTRTNFFVVKDKIIYSPLAKDILLGVTRKNVLDVARDAGFEVVEEDIPLKDLEKYDGAFLTSTSSKIIPIKKVGSFEYKIIPEEIRSLMTAFDKYLESLEK